MCERISSYPATTLGPLRAHSAMAAAATMCRHGVRQRRRLPLLVVAVIASALLVCNRCFVCAPIPRSPSPSPFPDVVSPALASGIGGLGFGSFLTEDGAWASEKINLDSIKQKVEEAERNIEKARALSLGKTDTAGDPLLRIAEQDLQNAKAGYKTLESLVGKNDALEETLGQMDVDVFHWIGNHSTEIGVIAVLGVLATIYWLLSEAAPLEPERGQKFVTTMGPSVSCTVSHVLVSSEEDALELLMNLTTGVPTLGAFQKVAAEYSQCPSGRAGGNAGNLGKLYRNVTDPEFEAVCFNPNTAMNTPLGPVKTQRGYHLVWITAREG